MTTITKIIDSPTQHQVQWVTMGYCLNPHHGVRTELAHGQVLVKFFDPAQWPWYEVRQERNFSLNSEHDPFEMQEWAVYELLGFDPASDDAYGPDEEDPLDSVLAWPSVPN